MGEYKGTFVSEYRLFTGARISTGLYTGEVIGTYDGDAEVYRGRLSEYVGRFCIYPIGTGLASPVPE
jgi:hypothetical protein